MFCEHIQIYLGDHIVVERNTHWYPNFLSGTIYLKKGQKYPVTVNGTGRLYVQRPAQKKEMVLTSEAGGQLDYYFIYGPKPDDIICGFRYLTGQASMLPNGHLDTGSRGNVITRWTSSLTLQRSIAGEAIL